MLDKDRAEWGEATALTLANVVNAIGADLRGLGQLEAVEFTPATTKLPGMRAEYLLAPDKLKLHFWADPAFPADLEDRLRAAFSAFPQEDVTIEYVPEVVSWYTCVANLQFGITPALVERLLGKVYPPAS